MPPSMEELFEMFEQLSVSVPYSFSGYAILGNVALRRVVKEIFLEKYGADEATDIDNLVSDNLDDERLARVCVDSKLDTYIMYKGSEEEERSLKEQIRNFKIEAAQYPVNCKGVLVAPKIAANLVKSLLGAVLRDSDYNYDDMYKSFEHICNPLFTKENRALHPYAELYKLHEEGEIVLKCDVKRTADAKNNFRVEINDIVYEDMTSDVDMGILKNRAAFSALQKLDTEKVAKNSESAHEASSSEGH